MGPGDNLRPSRRRRGILPPSSIGNHGPGRKSAPGQTGGRSLRGVFESETEPGHDLILGPGADHLGGHVTVPEEGDGGDAHDPVFLSDGRRFVDV